MWENSSAYSRVRFEDSATKSTRMALNKPQQTSQFQLQSTPTLTKRQLSQLQQHRKANTLPNGNPTVTTLGSATHLSSDFTV